MNALTKILIGAAGGLVLATTGASAAVVCNDEGDCWHVKGEAKYKPEVKVHVHPDDWKFADKDHRWRDTKAMVIGAAASGSTSTKQRKAAPRGAAFFRLCFEFSRPCSLTKGQRDRLHRPQR